MIVNILNVISFIFRSKIGLKYKFPLKDYTAPASLIRVLNRGFKKTNLSPADEKELDKLK